MSHDEVGQVQSNIILYVFILISFIGCTSSSARKLEFISQIVCIFNNYMDSLLTPPLFSIASFSGDLSSLTAPPFILSPTSLTEFPGKAFSTLFHHIRSMLIDILSIQLIGANAQTFSLPSRTPNPVKKEFWPSSNGS